MNLVHSQTMVSMNITFKNLFYGHVQQAVSDLTSNLFQCIKELCKIVVS